MDIISGLRCNFRIFFQYFSKVIHINRFCSVLSAKLFFKILLESGLSDDITAAVLTVSVFTIKFFQFFCGNLTGITDQWCHIKTVLINPDRIFFHIHARITVFVFHNNSNSIFRNIFCDRSRHILLIAVLCNRTSQCSQL